VTENKFTAAASSGANRREQYLQFTEIMRPHVQAALASGKTTRLEIATYLNRHRIRSHLGRRWTAPSVRYLLQNIGVTNAAGEAE
jgi:hypothetical protein